MPASDLLPELPDYSPIEINPPRSTAAVGFTKAAVVKMKCPPGKYEAFFWDASCRGLGVRALASGRRSWVYQYRDEGGRTRRLRLGDLTVVSLEDAREAARRHGASVVQGGNPSADRRVKRQAARVIDVVAEYLKYAEQKQRPRSYAETKRYLLKHCKSLHHECADTVPRAVIASELGRIASKHGPIAANRARAALSAMWFWGLRTGRIGSEANPVAFTIKYQETSRDRVLSDEELKAIWAATAGGGAYDRIVRLCLLTGCRREEIGALRWSEVGDEWITIGADRMKGGVKHEVALLPAIAACLPERSAEAAERVFSRDSTRFSGYSQCKARLDAKLAKAGQHLAHWGMHDLRRTISTRLHDAGAQPVVIEALLAHQQQGVAAVYNRASFRQMKRETLATWRGLLDGIVGGTLGGGYLVEVTGKAA
jgi:integrase